MILISITACARLGNLNQKDRNWRHLNRAEKLMEQGKYNQAIKENKQALQAAGNSTPGDQALYNLGKARIMTPAQKNNYQKSRKHFRCLVNNFPGSELKEEAKVWITLLSETISKQNQLEELKQLNTEQESRIKRLQAQAQHKESVIKYLRNQLKRLKQIDLELNKKK